MSARSARRRRAEEIAQQPYVKKMLEALDKGVYPRGTFSETWVRHDDWCPKLKGGLCTCNPDLEVQYR